jgi:hypothetical protein
MAKDIDTPLLTLDATDWRVADQAAEDLTDLQRQPWAFELRQGGYSGVYLVARAPDGTERNVNVEIDKGNLKLVVGGDASADPVAIVHVGENAVSVQPATHSGRGLPDYAVIDAEGIRLSDTDIAPGCTGEASTPSP